MLASGLITLREGLEAALIISIIAAYLVRTGRGSELGRVWKGAGLAAAGSLAVGLAVAAGSARLSERGQEIFEGTAGLVAVGVLTWMVFWMRRHARTIRSGLERRTEAALSSGHRFALPLLAFTAVGREGLETVLFLFAAFQSSGSPAASGGGAVAGLLCAAAAGYGIYRGGRRLNLSAFFQVTGAAIVVVAAGLAASAVHELDEAGLLRLGTATAWDISRVIGPSGVVGSVLRGLVGFDPRPTVLQVIVWWAYAVPVLTAFFWPLRRSRPEPARA